MSHHRYPSQDVVKEPHPISLKVLRLSRPSLVSQYPVAAPLSSALPPPTVPASLAYQGGGGRGDNAPTSVVTNLAVTTTNTNTDPFLLSPILNLPPAFGSAYVGESFSCTLCVNHDAPVGLDAVAGSSAQRKAIRDVRIEAEMKTPSIASAVKLELTSDGHVGSSGGEISDSPMVSTGGGGVDLEVGQTLQKVVRFDLKEEGNHVLAVTVSYYEATDTSGRTRTFRKLYQFICKSSLIVRTKAGPFPATMVTSVKKRKKQSPLYRRWMLEAQLENCGEDVLQLDQVMLHLEPALTYEDCNAWDVKNEIEEGHSPALATTGSRKPVLHPGEVEQVCFLIEETRPGIDDQGNGRLIFGVLGIGWRGEMGSRGYLSTGKLGTRITSQ